MTGRVDLDTLQRAIDAPMVVVTVASSTRRTGCLAGFWSLCSMDPPRCTVFIPKANHTYEVARRAGTLVLHLLRASDETIARHFGALTGDEVDTFAGITWSPGPGAAPVIAGLDWCCGPIRAEFDAGDHVGFVVDLADALGSVLRSDESQFGTQRVVTTEAGHPW